MKVKRNVKRREVKLLVIDLFCGAGGVTTGISRTKGCKVIACINHDANAIKGHAANHPEAKHFIEDIRTVRLLKLWVIVQRERIKHPKAKLLIHASLECTNFSKAKGGKPKDADSRSLADDMPRYAKALNPDYFTIENVREFMDWGPLDEDLNPIQALKGVDYNRWILDMKSVGNFQTYDWRILNAADYGAYTIRKRFFAMFDKEAKTVPFPRITHTKSGGLRHKKYKAVREILDLSVKGKSIFAGKPRSEKTLERVYAGLLKFVPKQENEFIAKYYRGRPEGKVKSLGEPIGTVTTVDHNSLVQLLKYNSINGKTGKYVPPNIADPSPTVAAQARLALVFPEYLIQYNGKAKDSVFTTDKPIGTLCTKDRFAVAQLQYVLRDYTKGFLNSLDAPHGALLTVPKTNLVTAETSYLMNPQGGTNQVSDLDKPCFTLIARMDKAPPYLVQTDSGDVAIIIFESDSPMTKKIKQFMVEHGIYDIKMRMLMIPELLAIQGFPIDYELIGTQTEQKKYIGNSVETTVMHKWAEAIVETIV